MNNISKRSAQYKTGDLIYRNTSLGAPGSGWLNLSTTQTVYTNSVLGKLLPQYSFWSTQTSQFGTTVILSIAYGNGTWVAGGGSGPLVTALRTSTDNGVTWNTQTGNFTSAIWSVAYGNGVWVGGGAGGNLNTSTDAINWNTQTSNFGASVIYSVAYGNGVWVAGGAGGALRTSTDAVNWNTQTSQFGSSIIYSVAYGNGVWVAGGAGGALRTLNLINPTYTVQPIASIPTGYTPWIKT